jgi:glycosyltransferase involved in cell wall biosynthesis
VSIGYDPALFEFIPNGFDLDQFSFDQSAADQVRTELGIPANSPIVGLVARMNPQKDHASFVSMAAILHKHRPDVHFVLVGQGVDHPKGQVARQISEEGIGSVFRLLGRRSDVARLMSAFDIFVSSSLAEAFPLVIGEAMATGVPCVVTDVGDSAFLVGDTGQVVPPKDPDALADACLHLLSMPADAQQSLRVAARERIRHNFDLDAIAQRYLNVYLNELAESGSASR